METQLNYNADIMDVDYITIIIEGIIQMRFGSAVIVWQIVYVLIFFSTSLLYLHSSLH